MVTMVTFGNYGIIYIHYGNVWLLQKHMVTTVTYGNYDNLW